MKMFLFRLSKYSRFFNTASLVLLVFSVALLVTGCGVPSFLTDLEQIIPVAGLAISGLLRIIGTLTANPELVAIAAAIQVILQKIDDEFAEINKLITTYKTSPGEGTLQQIEDGVNEVIADLKTILTVAGLPATVASVVQGVVQTVVAELEALLSAIPLLKSGTAGTSVTVLKPLPTQVFKANVEAALAPAT